MKTILNYLDDLKEKNGSDYATAKMLNISKEAVSQIRKRGTVADETALKMADLLKADRNEVLIAAAIARSEGEVKKSWENISRLSGIAASVLMACILTSNEAKEAGISNVNHTGIVYIMRSVMKGLEKRLKGAVLALARLLHLKGQDYDALLPSTRYVF